MTGDLTVYAVWLTIGALGISLLTSFIRALACMNKERWDWFSLHVALFAIVIMLAWMARIPAL